jgi:hypothetical protein
MLNLVDEYLCINETPNTDISEVTMFLLAKYYKTALAFKTLVVSGFEEDARILLRTLFEILINLSYLSRDSVNRSRQFIEFYFIEHKHLLDSIRKHYRMTYDKLDSNIKNKVISDYNRVKNKYSNETQWSGKSIHQMAKELGHNAKYWYDIVYSPESSYVHSSVSSSEKFLEEINNQKFVSVGPCYFQATDVLSKASEFTREMLLLVSTNWGISAEKVNDTWNECNQLIQEDIKSHD